MKKSSKKKRPTEEENYPDRSPQPRHDDERSDQPGARQRRQPEDMPRPDRDWDDTSEPGRAPGSQEEE
jgi:hypothetical protein